MPSVSTSQVFDIAYVLDEQNLRQLDNLLKEFSPQIEYELECSDSSTFNYDSVEPIIKFANISKRRITKLTARSPFGLTKPPTLLKIYMTLEVSSFLPPIYYSIDGEDEKNVFYMANKLDEFFVAHKQWYTNLVNIYFFLLFFLFIGMCFLIPAILYSLRQFPDQASGISVSVALIIILCLAIILNRLFPKSIFAIGEGVKRYERIKTCRTILSTLLIGMFISMIFFILGRIF
jgi:hypothetical protein